MLGYRTFLVSVFLVFFFIHFPIGVGQAAAISLDSLVDQQKRDDGAAGVLDLEHSLDTIEGVEGRISPLHVKPEVQTDGCTDITECTADVLLRHEPGKKRIPWQAMVPPVNRAVVDRLNDPNTVKITTDNINSIAFLEKVTVGLAEPTVGGAINSATMEAEMHTNNTFAADAYLLKIAERFPASAPFVEAYFHCVQKQMSKALPMGLSQAQAFCRMDKTTASLDISGGGQSLPGLIHHPSWDIRDGGVGDRITAVDLIFNEESTIDLANDLTISIPVFGNYTLKPINPLDNTDKLATEFALYYGDVEYSFPHSAADWGSVFAGQKGLEAQYKIINPIIDIAY